MEADVDEQVRPSLGEVRKVVDVLVGSADGVKLAVVDPEPRHPGVTVQPDWVVEGGIVHELRRIGDDLAVLGREARNPEFFTRFLPGWIINVATIIHSDEALLATGFIFTVHFFNTHFRPDKFPMDTVIFTGRVPVEELKEDRPREYEELMSTRGLKKHLAEPLPPVLVKVARIFGTCALLLGLAMIFLIVYAVLFGYR